MPVVYICMNRHMDMYAKITSPYSNNSAYPWDHHSQPPTTAKVKQIQKKKSQPTFLKDIRCILCSAKELSGCFTTAKNNGTQKYQK